MPHLLQTLRFQIGFAQSPENPLMITQHAVHDTQSSSDMMDNHQTSTFKRGVFSKELRHILSSRTSFASKKK